MPSPSVRGCPLLLGERNAQHRREDRNGYAVGQHHRQTDQVDQLHRAVRLIRTDQNNSHVQDRGEHADE